MDTHTAMVAKTRTMLSLQNEMNCHVDLDWAHAGRAWYRAIWIECAELMEHYGGWKWWKHSAPDLPQVILEIVDIWHFGLSMRIVAGDAEGDAAERIVEEWMAPPPALDFTAEVERLAAAALVERRFAVGSVCNLLGACGRGFDDLYRAYVAKNVLNVFRQDHGYKSGSYRKNWQGREDNEVLVELLAGLDSDTPGFRDAVYAALAARYAQVAAGSGA